MVASAPRAHADHPTDVTPGLNVLLLQIANDRGKAVWPGTQQARVVARNPIAISGSGGAPIKVCSVARYKMPVQEAIKVWNAGAGVKIAARRLSRAVVSLLVVQGPTSSLNAR